LLPEWNVEEYYCAMETGRSYDQELGDPGSRQTSRALQGCGVEDGSCLEGTGEADRPRGMVV
jgi:hypothetical protein